MIDHLKVLELGTIADRGGSLEVDGKAYSALELAAIAARLAAGATLKVHHSKALTAAELGTIAARKPGKVIFC